MSKSMDSMSESVLVSMSLHRKAKGNQISAHIVFLCVPSQEQQDKSGC